MQASVFAGFAFSFFEKASRFEGYEARAYQTPEALRIMFVMSATCAMALNISAMFFANCLALFAPGLALRGDGSEAMDRAVDGLALEYRILFLVYFLGIVSLFGLVIIYSLMQADWVLSTCVVAVLFYLLNHTMNAFRRLYKKFRLPPSVAQSGAFNRDDGGRMVDPLVQAAQVAALSRHAQWLERLSQRKRWSDWPLRQYLYTRLFFDDFVGVSAEMFELRYSSYAKNSADDGITRVVLRSIESRTGDPERTVDYASHDTLRRGNGAPRGGAVELASVSLDGAAGGGAVPRKQPSCRFGRAAVEGSGSDVGCGGLLDGGADISSLSHVPFAWHPTAQLAPLGEVDGPTRRAASAGCPGSSAVNHVGAAGFSSPSGRVRNPLPRADDDETGEGKKPWDVGGRLVEWGESWLQRL